MTQNKAEPGKMNRTAIGAYAGSKIHHHDPFRTEHSFRIGSVTAAKTHQWGSVRRKNQKLSWGLIRRKKDWMNHS